MNIFLPANHLQLWVADVLYNERNVSELMWQRATVLAFEVTPGGDIVRPIAPIDFDRESITFLVDVELQQIRVDPDCDGMWESQIVPTLFAATKDICHRNKCEFTLPDWLQMDTSAEQWVEALTRRAA